MQHPQQVKCPNCGSMMNLEFAGDLNDKRAICRFCGTTFDVPDSFTRVTKRQTRRKGFLRGTETVEEVTEFRSDHPIPPAQLSQSNLRQPHVVQIPLTGASPSTGIGGCISLLIGLVVIVGIVGSIIIAAGGSGLKNALDSLSNSVSGAANTIETRRTLKGMDSSADHLAYSPDGTIIVGGNSTQMILWNAASGSIIAEIDPDFTIGELAFTPDGSRLMVFDGGNIAFYDPTDGSLVRTLEGSFSNVTFSADRQTIAARTYDEEMIVVSLESGEVIKRLGSMEDYPMQMVLSADGRFLAAGGTDNRLHVWDTMSGTQIFNGTVNALTVNYMAFHPQKNELVIGESETLEFYDVDESGVRFLKTVTINETTFSINSLGFSPDGSEIALGNFFGGARLVKDGKIKTTLNGEDGVRALAYSPDGSSLVGASAFGDLYEWQIREPSAAPKPDSKPADPTATPPPSESSKADTAPTTAVTCQISPSNQSARVRSGPGTDFGVSGSLDSDTSVNANGRAVGSDGSTWWRLADGSGWVREDVVNEQGGCAELPLAQ